MTSSGADEQGEEDGADGDVWEQGGDAAQCLVLWWIWRTRRDLRGVNVSIADPALVSCCEMSQS
jgi:hypothetical protein